MATVMRSCRFLPLKQSARVEAKSRIISETSAMLTIHKPINRSFLHFCLLKNRNAVACGELCGWLDSWSRPRRDKPSVRIHLRSQGNQISQYYRSSLPPEKAHPPTFTNILSGCGHGSPFSVFTPACIHSGVGRVGSTCSSSVPTGSIRCTEHPKQVVVACIYSFKSIPVASCY